MSEIIVDSFAGGGGASTGIELALGRSPDIAINHDAAALGMHAANHPLTRHLANDVHRIDPAAAVAGAEVGLFWASPDCKHFSKAKGGRPVEQGIRDLAWVVVEWAAKVSPRIIILENVEEFRTWGPLKSDGRPCLVRKGRTFNQWCEALRALDYVVECRELVAADYGTPTTRKRLFVIARRDGLPIVWPDASHGAPNEVAVIAGLRAPWLTAADHVIDWTLDCPSIFLSREAARAIGAQRPLVDATMARIARGMRRYVLESADPFLVPVTHRGDDRIYAAADPLRAITAARRGEFALVKPFLTKFRGNGAGASIERPFPTVTANSFLKRPGGAPSVAVVTAFLAKHFGGYYEGPGASPRDPLGTVTAKDHHAVVSAGLVNMHGAERRQSAPRAPVPTIAAGGWHMAEVRAFLMKYHGTGGQDQSCRDPLHTADAHGRFGVVTVAGEAFRIVDIGMRMLSPRELFRAQGFPESYIIDRRADGGRLTKTEQIRMCGNSVCPPVAAALVAANYSARRLSAPAPFVEAAE
jgi:DNA (cytosine-5)-methyltransferase 1